MNFKILCLMAFLVLASCSINEQAPPAKEKDPTSWDQRASANIQKLLKTQSSRYTKDEIEHLQWVAKASLLLRGQKEISFETDNIETLKKMSKEEVVDLFLKSDYFYNTLADFSMYFGGFRADPFYLADQKLNSKVFAFPNGLTAALSIAKNKTFFNFFNDTHPFYVEPFGRFADSLFAMFSLPPPAQPLQNNNEKRDYFYSQILLEINSLKSLTLTDLKIKEVEVCTLLSELDSFTYPDSFVIGELGIAAVFGNTFRDKYLQKELIFNICKVEYVAEENKFIYELLQASLAKERLNMFVPFFEALQNLDPAFDSSLYSINTVLDVRSLDKNEHGEQFAFKNPEIARTLNNSSTNMNRKRGAYILKHYFCDDLTPVNVKISDDHAKDVHGSNPSCYACHYKLDPMAGFFKDFGMGFNNFSNSKNIVFDDFADADLQEYQKQWLKPDGKSWNIGYVQSTQFDHLNSYGESLGDLHQILRTAPEVKRCMVKRALEYSTSPQQMFDPGFIDEVATIFSQEEAVSPKKAMQNLFKRLVLSKTFTKTNANTSECYDLKNGTDTANRPPCQIAHILETNCVKCHSSATGKTSLDLSKWIVTADGTMGFAHIDKTTGLQKTSKQTFSTMLNRITSSYEFDRMPPGDMNPVYRQILFQWLSQQEVKK